jgi:hypothetical protein
MMNYAKPEIQFTAASLLVINKQTLMTKSGLGYVDILWPDVGALDQDVTASAYEADE